MVQMTRALTVKEVAAASAPSGVGCEQAPPGPEDGAVRIRVISDRFVVNGLGYVPHLGSLAVTAG